MEGNTSGVIEYPKVPCQARDYLVGKIGFVA